jgi:hypothetical protein
MLWYLSKLVLLCWVKPVNLHFITCDCLQRVFWVFLKQLLKDKGICWCDSSTASHSVHGTQVSRKSDVFRLSVRMIWCDANEILSILATSWAMILLFWKIGSFTQNTFFICFAVDGFLEHLATSTEVTPILSWNTIWKAHIFHIVSTLETSLNVLKVTVTYFPNLKQDLMQTFW